MKLFNLSLSTLVLRFYLLMAVVIIAGFSNLWILGLLALPIFFSALMGMEIRMPRRIKDVNFKKSYDTSSKQHYTA